jgi:hypothetical protein
MGRSIRRRRRRSIRRRSIRRRRRRSIRRRKFNFGHWGPCIQT